MLDLLDEALAIEYCPVRVVAVDGHCACASMADDMHEWNLYLMSKLRRDACLWVPDTGLRCLRKYAGRCDRRLGGRLRTDLLDEGRRLYHAQLCYKPFGHLLNGVFVLDTDAGPAV